MTRFVLTIFFMCALPPLSGCFHQQVVVDPGYNAAQATPDYTQTHFHILGLVGINNTAPLDALCPEGAGLVETVTYLGLFLVTIESHGVYCK